MKQKEDDLWSLVTAAVASLTVGVLLYNTIHMFARHHQAIATESMPAEHHLISRQHLALQLLMETRTCQSPAVDAYTHINVTCLKRSPTARYYQEYLAAGGHLQDMVVHIEQHADYDGVAVRWGIKHKFKSILACAKACWQHQPGTVDGPFKDFPCNAFTYCNAEVCFEPDIHQHTKGDCWLKFTEAPASPEVNMRGLQPEHFRAKHPQAPMVAPWIAGVLLPPGVQLTNGSWSPRYYW
eukprot:gene13419-13547_t